jgi:RNA-splicing ligase RtcB
MVTVHGKYNDASVYAVTVDDKALEQIKKICDSKDFAGETIRVMPDTHMGTGCVIGYTMTLKNKRVVPSFVGVDIGCGILTSKFDHWGGAGILKTIDSIIHEEIPCGVNVRDKFDKSVTPYYTADISSLKCYEFLKNTGRLKNSMGTLGGGNHFIEVDVSDTGDYYLVIHSGSRNLGVQVCEFYQGLAEAKCGNYKAINERYDFLITEEIDRLKKCGKQRKIEEAIRELNAQRNAELATACPDPHLAYVTDADYDNYIHDMEICQRWAAENRANMALLIGSRLGITFSVAFDTVHNYINMDDMILRKGAISAKKGERITIPLNMFDGSIIATGKGNADWNWSAPHGAGRLMSRTAARERIRLEDFKAKMAGIYSTTVCGNTIDEAPQAYKSAEEIINGVYPTCEIVDIIRPVYNFKDTSENSPFPKRHK